MANTKTEKTNKCCKNKESKPIGKEALADIEEFMFVCDAVADTFDIIHTCLEETMKEIKKNKKTPQTKKPAPCKKMPVNAFAFAFTDAEQKKIAALRKKGATIKEIAKAIHRSDKKVAPAVHLFDKTVAKKK